MNQSSGTGAGSARTGRPGPGAVAPGQPVRSLIRRAVSWTVRPVVSRVRSA
ncbi:hypothetical protein [Nonomuraea salmonea]|uniref:hypothetical protein n=1 Tax=Nonomuraea salmonea TaxID=46181 RepID=UPI0031EE0314